MADESANELILKKKNNKIRCLAPLTFLFNEQMYDYIYIYIYGTASELGLASRTLPK